MHTLVFVLVPAHAPDVEGTVRALLEPYRRGVEGPNEQWPRWDAWVFGGRWDGLFRVGGAPRTDPGSWRHNTIPVAELPADVACGALLTSDGHFHTEWMSLPLEGPDAEERAHRVWRDYGRPLLLRDNDHLVVVVDLHT